MAGLLSAGVWLPVPLCMPGLWRDGRAVVLLKPAEWLAWMRVLKPFLHVSACPDVLLCTDCVLVGCVMIIGWSVGVVWVSRHEQSVSLCRGVLRWCVAVCAGVHAGAVARRAGSGLPKWAGACMKTNLMLGF